MTSPASSLPARPVALVLGALGVAAVASLGACNTSDYKRSRVEGAAAQQQLRTEKAREAYERQQIQPYQQ